MPFGEVVYIYSNDPATPPQSDYEVYLGRGQSLIIGTQDGTFNTKPVQPELDQSKYFMLDGVEVSGVQNNAIADTGIAGIVGLSEVSSILAQQSYYTPATGALSVIGESSSNRLMWLPSGVGGTSIENLSAGGNTNAVANEIAQFEHLKNNNITANVKAITFYHGGANFSDTTEEYYNKLVAYKAEQIARVQTYFPQSNPEFILWQHGGENVVTDVMVAQLKAHKDGVAKCLGATYWLNRIFPNVSKDDVIRVGTGSPERVHLKTKGYQYAGEMIGAEALYVDNYEWVDNSNITLSCVGNVGQGLTIDTAQPNMPAFDGSGIEIVKPNGVRIPATSVTPSGSNLNVSFGVEEFLAGDRLLIGGTPRDLAYYGDYEPSSQGPNYVGNHIVGTNIRTVASRASKLGNEPFYDWLCVDRLETEVKASTPAGQTLGSNIWFGDSYGDVGFGTVFDFDSVTGTVTITKDGQQNTIPSARTFGAGTNKETLAWAIKAGKTFQVDFDVADMNTAGRLQFFVGGAGLTITSASLVDGHYTGEVTATKDYEYSLALRENTGFAITDFNGTISNIQLREKLTA